MESTGARLKKLRLEKGLSLEEVHKNTKIHLDILKALEENSLINLNPIYIKGFLKIYCKFLGVNPRDYIPDYKEPQSIVQEVSATQEKPISFLKTVSIRLASLKTTHINIKRVFIFILILIFLSIGLFSLGKLISSKGISLSKKAKSSVSLPAKAKKTEERPKPEKTKTLTTIHKAQYPKVVPRDITGAIRLGIQAKEDCWIQLKTDGRVVFQNILKKGRSESWQAKDKIELSLGSAGSVALEVNGKLIPSLGRKGQVLKNILITKEGLNIPR